MLRQCGGDVTRDLRILRHQCGGGLGNIRKPDIVRTRSLWELHGNAPLTNGSRERIEAEHHAQTSMGPERRSGVSRYFNM
eukprot:6192342-Pyramimonas_sp.AAC.1